MESISTAAYNRGWETKWDDMKRYGPFSRHIRRILKDMIRPLKIESVLDVGCGQGSLLEELRTEFPYLKPCSGDFSKSAVELARQSIPDGGILVSGVNQGLLDE